MKLTPEKLGRWTGYVIIIVVVLTLFAFWARWFVDEFGGF